MVHHIMARGPYPYRSILGIDIPTPTQKQFLKKDSGLIYENRLDSPDTEGFAKSSNIG